jgi:predicted O-methyltransferase YrrM
MSISREGTGDHMVRRIARAIPPLRTAYRSLRDFSRRDPLIMALHAKIFEWRRLKLPEIEAETFCPNIESVKIPAFHPFLAGEDAPLTDLFFLLSAGKARGARRILEVGTFRARSTFALYLNCPDAHIVSYDIQVLPSPYRTALENAARVELRHASFTASAATLQGERPFDFIFIDGAHDIQSVCDDSRLAFELVDPTGLIIWHDYRQTGYFAPELQVPEALEVVREGRQLFHVRGTTCAVYCPRALGNYR